MPPYDSGSRRLRAAQRPIEAKANPGIDPQAHAAVIEETAAFTRRSVDDH